MNQPPPSLSSPLPLAAATKIIRSADISLLQNISLRVLTANSALKGLCTLGQGDRRNPSFEQSPLVFAPELTCELLSLYDSGSQV
jgi:hypothetical protein